MVLLISEILSFLPSYFLNYLKYGNSWAICRIEAEITITVRNRSAMQVSTVSFQFCLFFNKAKLTVALVFILDKNCKSQ